VIKDPRLSVTAEFWASVAAVDVSLVPLRDPLEVAQSLRHRNGMAPSRAAALWTRYTLDAVIKLPNAKIVPLADLTSGSKDAVIELAKLVGLSSGVDAAIAVAADRSRTWAPDSVFVPPTDDPDFAFARSLFSILSSGVDVDDLRPSLQRLASQWGVARLVDPEDLLTNDDSDMHKVAIRAAAEKLASLQHIAEKERISSAELRSERDEARRRVRMREAELGEANDRLKTLDSTVADLRKAVTDVEQAAEISRAAAQAERDEIQRTLSAATAERDEIQRTLSAATAERDEIQRKHETTQSALTASAAAADEQSRRARSAERQYERLVHRRSVRVALGVARPFRPAIRVVRSVRRRRSPRTSSVTSARSSDKERGGTQLSVRSRPTHVGRDGARPHGWADIVSRLTASPRVTVVVPVFNAPDDVERCLALLIQWTPVRHDILVIDDASTDERIGPILHRFSNSPNVRLLANPSNLGFTATVNRGFASTSGDVILLNSDARVGPNWVTNLRVAAYSGDRIASASAVSDNAGAFSLPETGTNAPTGLDEASLARLYSHRSKRPWPMTPTGHGFCMFVRRDALADVGVFDIEQFPRGYGEENDWSLRASKKGWSHVVDDATMVFHANAASFDPSAKKELVAQARERIDKLHPEYTSLVQKFLSVDMQPIRQEARVTDALARQIADQTDKARRVVRPRLLSIVQAGRGGTPKTNQDLMTALQSDWDTWILTSDARRIQLFHVVGDQLELVEEAVSETQLGSNRATDPVYREFVSRVLLTTGFELVHVRHLFKHSQDDVPEILQAIDLPAVLSFHDYYWVCPNVHLLDERGDFCGGHCTAGAGDCDHPVPGATMTRPLKHDWVHQWRADARGRFGAFDAFVTTTQTAKEVLVEHYPELVARKINVIPHGRDLDDEPSVAVTPDPKRIRIAVIGNLSGAKGGQFLRRLLTLDKKKQLDVHVLGDCEPEFADLRCTFHGRYERSAFSATLAPIKPSFAALLSVWPETWSHTLTEAWSVGLPVLVTQEGGALEERVAQHGGGWIIDAHDPESALAEIIRISHDADEWEHQAGLASVDHLTSVDQMADSYREVYAKALSRRSLDHLFVDVRVLTDQAGKAPGSAHVRALRRFEHPTIRRSVSALVNSGNVLDGDKRGVPDIVWLERNAISPGAAAEAIVRRERYGSKIVVDLDDDLLHEEGLPDQFARYVPTMRQLVGIADLVTVSTPFLATVVAEWSDRVEVLENQLDESLWGPLNPEGTPRKAADRSLDILYMGTATHADDLELLREPLERLRREHSTSVRLHVVGGRRPGPDEWFDRIHVPDDSKEYPAFVKWLRSIGVRFDFAVAPLVDSEFTRSKSDLKFLEYAALGLPAIFSDRPAYRATVTDGVDGHLVGDDSDDWLRSLQNMSSSEHRDALRLAAMTHVAHRTIGSTSGAFVDMLERTMNASDTNSPIDG
jgi:GT2 family glycosyltransferase/glycosyltransferase involved in cell wall biosynthesis